MNDGKKYLISLGLNDKDLRDIENRMTTTLSTAMENGMSLDRSGKAVVKKDMEVLLGYVKELTSSISSATPDVAKQLTGNLKNVLPMIAGLADKMKQVNASTDWMKQGFTFGEDIYTTIKALDTVQKDVADVRAEISELTTSLNPFLNALKANDPSAFFKKFGDGFQSVGNDASTMRATITKELKAIESSGSGLKNLMKDIKASSRNFVDVKSAEEALNIFTSLQSKIENYEDLAGSFGKGIAIEHDIEEVKDYAKALVELQNLSKNKFAKNLFDVKGSTMFTDDIKAELQEITQSIATTIKQAGDTLQRTVDGLNLKEVQLSVVLPDADAKKIEKQANAWVEKFNEKFKTKPIQLSVDMADPFKTYKSKTGQLTKKQRELAEQAKATALESLRKISDDETLEANFSGLDDPETSKILRKLAESFDKIRKGVELGQTSILEATKQWRSEIEKHLTLSFKWKNVDTGDGANQLLNDLQIIMDEHLMQINVDKKNFIAQIEEALRGAQFNINGNIKGSSVVSGATPIVLTGAPIINTPSEQPKTPPTPPTPSESFKSEDTTPSAAEIIAKPANALTRAVEDLDTEIESLKEKIRFGHEAVEQRKAAKANADANIAAYNAERETADEARKLVLDTLIDVANAAKNADIKEYNSTSKDDQIKVLTKRKAAIDEVVKKQEDPSKLVVDAVKRFYDNNNNQADRRLREIALIDKDLSAKYTEVINLEKEISKLNPVTDGNKISELRGKIDAIKPEIDMLFGGVTESVVAEYVALEKKIEKAKQRYAQTNSSEDKLTLDGLEKRQQEIQSGLSYLQNTKGVDKAFFEKFKEATNIEREIMSLDPIKDKSKMSDLQIQLKKIVAEMGNIFQGLKEKTTKELEDVEAQLTEARKKYTLSNSAQDKKIVEQLVAKQEKLTKGRDAVQYLENNRVKKQLFEQSGFRDYSGLDINSAIQFVNEILKGSTTLADTLTNLNANGVNLKGNILDNLVYFIRPVQKMMGIISQSSQEWEQTDELKQRFLRIADLAQQISGLFSIKGNAATIESLQEFIDVFGKVPTLQPVIEAAKNHLKNLLELSGYVGDDRVYNEILGSKDVNGNLFKMFKSEYSNLPEELRANFARYIPSIKPDALEGDDISNKLRDMIINALTNSFNSGAFDHIDFKNLTARVPDVQKLYDIVKLISLYANQLKTDNDLRNFTGNTRNSYIKKLQGQIEKGDAMVATVGSGASQRTYGLQNKYNNTHHPIPGVNRNLNYDSSSFLSSLGVDNLEYEKFILSQGLFAERDKLQNELAEIMAKEEAEVDKVALQRIQARIDAIGGMLKKSGTTVTSEAEAKARVKEINEQMFANMSLSSPRDMAKQEYGYDQTTYAQTAKKIADKVKAQEKAAPKVKEKLQKEIDELTAILNNREVILEAVRALQHDKELAQLNASVADDAAQKWKGYRSTKYQHKTTLSNLFNKTVGEYTDENGNVWDMSEARKRFTTALQYGTMKPDIINSLFPLLDNYEDTLAELRNMPEDAQANKSQLAIKDGLKAKLSVLKDTILNIYYEAEGWLLNDIFTSKIQSIETQFKTTNQGVLSDHSGVESHYKGLKAAEESRYITQKTQIENKYADQIDIGGGLSDIRAAYEQERRKIISDKYNEKIRIFQKQQEEELKAFENDINTKNQEAKTKYGKDSEEYRAISSQGNVNLSNFKKNQEKALTKAKIDKWNEATSEVPNELEDLEKAARDAANQTVESVANAKKEALRQSLQKRVGSGKLSEADANKELEQGIADINKQVQNGAIKGAITKARNKANKALEDFVKGVAEKYGITADLTEKTIAGSIIKGDESAKQAELEAATTEHNARLAEIEAQRVAAVKEQQEKNAVAIKKNMEQQQADMAKAAAELQSSNGHWMSDNTILRQIGSGERAGAVKDKIDADAQVKEIDDSIKNLMEQGRLTQGMVDGTEQLGELQQQQTKAMQTNAAEIEKQTDVAQQSADSTQKQQQYYTGGFVGGGIAINTNGLAQETTLRGIWQLLNGGPPQGGWGDIQGIVARTVDELLPSEKVFANSMASMFKRYEGIDYETAGAIGKGGLIGKLQQGNARSVPQETWDAALAQAVKEEVLALLHNHPNKINALTWQDVDSGLYNANHNKHVKVFGSVGDQSITSLDFTGIDDTTGKEIIAKYRQRIDDMVNGINVDMVANLAALRHGTDKIEKLGISEEVRNSPAFGYSDTNKENFAWSTIIGRTPELKEVAEQLINNALLSALGDKADAFKQFDLSDMQGFMQSIVKPVQQPVEPVTTETAEQAATKVAENIVQAGAQAAVESVTPAEITPNPNAKPVPAKKTIAEDVMDALRAGYKSDPKFAEIEGEKLLHDGISKINSFTHSKDQTSDQALRNIGNAYIKLKESLNTKIVEQLGPEIRKKIEVIIKAAEAKLDASGVEIGKDLKGEVITPELLQYLQPRDKRYKLAVGKIIGKANNPIMMRNGELLQSAFVSAHVPENKAEKDLVREKLGLEQQITEEKKKQSATKPKDDAKAAEAQAGAEAKVTAEEEKQLDLAQQKEKVEEKTTGDLQAQAQATSDANKANVEPAPIESASGIPQGTGGGIPGLVNTLSQLLQVVAKDTSVQEIIKALGNGIKSTGSGGKQPDDGSEKKSLNLSADEALARITAQVNTDYHGAVKTGNLRANANSYSVDFWRQSVEAQKEAEEIQEQINKLEAEGKANTEGYNALIQQRNSLLQKQEKITLRINKDTGEITSKVGIENFAVGANAAEKELQSVQGILSQLHDANALQFNPDGSLNAQNQSINNWIQSMQALQVTRDKFASQGTLFDSKNQQVLSQMTAQVAQYRKEVMALLGTESKFGGNVIDTFANPQALAAQGEVYNKLLGIATATGKVKMETVKFDDTTNTLSYTVEKSKNQVQDMTLHMNALSGAVSQNVVQTRHVDTAWQAFGKSLKGKWQEVARYLTTFGSIYRVWGMLKQGVGYIKEIDTALTELKKVTDATDREYAQFLKTMSKTGATIGATVKDLTSSAADWARLGYNLRQAGDLAKNTAILMNVSEFDDVSKATDTLISSLQAFKKAGQDVGTFSMEIIDKYNEVGNNYAISTSDLAESLTRSSAALVAANNSLEESIAMTTAANTTIQDPESVGNALKVVSMRIRGVKSELEEAGEDTENMVTNTAKLQEKIMALTNIDGNGGIDILTNTGEFKSTYEILLAISKVWKDMDDTSQAALLELVAGKTRGSVVAALFQNGDVLEEAYKSATEASGSAMNELNTYLDSIQGKLDQFTNSVQTMWMNLLDSKVIKFFVDLGTKLVNLADKVGVIRLLFVGLTTMFMRKSGISSIGEFFKSGAVSAEEASKKLAELKTRYAELEGYKGKKYQRKQDSIKNQMKPYQAIVDGAENAKKAQDNLTKAQNKLQTAETNLANAQSKGYKPKKIKEYQAAVDAAKQEVADATEEVRKCEIANENLGNSGVIGFEKLKNGAKAFGKQLWSIGKQMLEMYAITAFLDVLRWAGEGVVDFFDGLHETAEEAQEKLDELKNELESIESEIDNLNSELETTNESIEELMEQGTLSFTEQEELDRLKAVSAELEKQIKFQETLKESKSKVINAQAVNATSKYLNEISFNSDKSKTERQEEAKENGTMWGTAAGLAIAAGLAVAGVVTGGAALAVAGGLAAVGGVGVGAIAEWGAGASYDSEQSVADAIANMKDTREKFKADIQDAIDSGDAKAYNEATEALNNYDAKMADHMSVISQNYNSFDWETATEEQKKQMQEQINLFDAYNIAMGGKDAKVNAIDRLFGEDASEVVKVYRDKIKNDIKNGKVVDFQEMIDITGLDDDLDELGITTQDVADYFTKLGEAGADAAEKIDFSDVVSELAKIEGAFDSVKSVMEEFRTEGIVSASTLEGMQEEFGSLGDAWENYAETMMSGTASMWEVQAATEDLAKAYLDKHANDITDDNKLTYVAQLEEFGIKNAKEFVQSYINNDFFDSTSIKSVTTEFGELSDKIVDAANAYDDIIEKDETWSKGNVDYSNRPIVSAETMQAKYPEFDGDVATTYDMGMALLDSEGNIAYTVKVTPILEDGTVIDEKTLVEYVEGKLQDAYNNGGIQGVLDADKNGYNIVIATAIGEVEQEAGVLSEFDTALQDAKDAHLELVNTSAQGLIDLAAEKGIVLELADAYKILQAEEEARNAETQYQNNMASAATNKHNVETQNAALLQKQQEVLSAIENTTMGSTRSSINTIYSHLTNAFNKTGQYANYSDEDLNEAITNLKNNLDRELQLLSKEYSWADLFPDLAEVPSVELDPDVITSKQNLHKYQDELQGLLDDLKLEVTPEVNFNENNALEETAEVEEAFASLKDAYDEFKEHNIVSAKSLVGLEEAFGNVEGFENFTNILGDSTSTIEDVNNAIQGLANGFLNDFDYSTLFGDDGLLDESEVKRVASQLENIGVESANELIRQKAEAYNTVKEIYGIDLTNYENAEQAKTDWLIQKTGEQVNITGQDLVNKVAELYGVDLTNFKGTWDEKVTYAKNAALEIVRANAAAQLSELDEQFTSSDPFIANKSDDPTLYLTDSKSLVLEKRYLNKKKQIENKLAEAEAEINALDAGTIADDKNIFSYYEPTTINPEKLGGNDDDKDGSDSDNEIDWLDHYFTKIENKIKEKEADLENIMSADIGSIDDKNTIIDGIIDLYESKIPLLKTAMNAYSDRATDLFNGFSSDIQQKIRNGSIDINEYDDETAEDIQDYFDYITKASDLEVELDGIRVKIADLSLQNFEDTATAFDNEIEEKFQSDQDLIEAEIGYLEELGQRVSPDLYEKLIKIQKEEQKVLESKKKTLENILTTELAASHIQVGDKQWYEMVNAINEVDEALIESKNDIESFQNSINEIYWDNFEKLIDQIDAVNSELSNLFDLLSEDNKVVDEFGNWTDEGIASLGLLAQQIENAKAKANEYAKAIKDLDKDYDGGKYSLDEYNEKMAELKDNYLSEIKNIEDAKDAMVDLNKVRIDAVKEAIDKEIEALEEKNEKLKEELDLEKEQYEWQKSVAEKEKSIADIQRRLNALAGDNSASAIAERRKLQAELSEAQAEMDDMWYEHSIEEQQKSLDESLENYKENKEDEKEALDKWLEEEEKVIQESFDLFNSNVDVVASVLEAFEAEHGIKLSEAVTSPWKSGIDAMEAYRQKLAEMKQEQENAKQNAEDTADDIVESANKPQTTTPPVANQPSASGSTTAKPSASTQATSTSAPGYGSTVTVKKSATNFSRDGGSGTKMQSWVPGSSFTVYGSDSDEVLIGKNGGYTGWVKLSDIEGYYKGTTGVKDDQWAFTDELGPELTLHAGPNGKLQYLTKGSGVVTADLTKRLMEWGELDPTKVLEQSRVSVGAPHITTNNFDIDLSFGSLVHVDHCDQNTLPDLQKMVRGEFDNMMKTLNQKLKRK